MLVRVKAVIVRSVFTFRNILNAKHESREFDQMNGRNLTFQGA